MSGIVGYFTTSPVVLMGRSQETTTTTTTAAPACAQCYEWTVINNTGADETFFYYSCDGSCTLVSDSSIAGGEAVNFCNCNDCGSPTGPKGLIFSTSSIPC